MYVAMKELLEKANRERYAVLAINCFNLETVQAVIQAAEELQAPIIVNVLQEHLQHYFDYRYLTYPIKKMAENAETKVGLNLDHGQDVAFVKQCIQAGFSSVMMDASRYPLVENKRITKEIVSFAQAYNASVEAEIGNMGEVATDHLTNQAMYTDPEQAIAFIRETGVDCLAVSYGSSHGTYPKGYVPTFHFDIVQKIKHATNLPLVLHGGSGAGKANILRSIDVGINKINIGSDFMKAQLDACQEQLAGTSTRDYPAFVHRTMLAGKELIKYYIELSGSKNQAF